MVVMAAIWPASGQGSGSESLFPEVDWPIGEYILTVSSKQGPGHWMDRLDPCGWRCLHLDGVAGKPNGQSNCI